MEDVTMMSVLNCV